MFAATATAGRTRGHARERLWVLIDPTDSAACTTAAGPLPPVVKVVRATGQAEEERACVLLGAAAISAPTPPLPSFPAPYRSSLTPSCPRDRSTAPSNRKRDFPRIRTNPPSAAATCPNTNISARRTVIILYFRYIRITIL